MRTSSGYIRVEKKSNEGQQKKMMVNFGKFNVQILCVVLL